MRGKKCILIHCPHISSKCNSSEKYGASWREIRKCPWSETSSEWDWNQCRHSRLRVRHLIIAFSMILAATSSRSTNVNHHLRAHGIVHIYHMVGISFSWNLITLEFLGKYNIIVSLFEWTAGIADTHAHTHTHRQTRTCIQTDPHAHSGSGKQLENRSIMCTMILLTGVFCLYRAYVF